LTLVINGVSLNLMGECMFFILSPDPERLENSRVPPARLSGTTDCYKIKLRSLGFCLVYQVYDQQLVIVVIAVGRRKHDLVYRLAQTRI
jgi:mRNA interferase RelE/StbE